MNYKFQDLVDISALSNMLNNLYELSAIPSAIIDMEGQILTWSGGVRLCEQFYRKHPVAEKACVRSDTQIRKEIKEGKPYSIYKCPHGLVDSCAPVIIEDQHVANVFTGQMLHTPLNEEIIAEHKKLAHEYGFNEADYLDALKEVRVFPIEKHKNILEFLSQFAKLLAQMGLTNLQMQEQSKLLQKSEEKFRDILENLKDVYFETTLKGSINYCSPSGSALSGYPMAELIGNTVDMLYHNPEDRKGMLAELEQHGRVRGHELLFKKKNGELYDVSINADIFCDDAGKPEGMTGTIRDITQQKKLKEQLNRSRKMESLGLMAGGIAHDLNNILSGLVSYPDFLLMQVQEDSPLRKPLETIKDSGRRAAEVVSDLLSVAKGVAAGRDPLNLNHIIQEYLDSAEHGALIQKHPDIKFYNNLDPELLNISCSSPHIKKILMNLLFNASEAITDTGTVTISTANKYLDDSLDGYENIQIGEYVFLSVSDTGSGITRSDLEMIFEPFYTKKVLGRGGTGLGLAVVWNTVQDHDGYINVTSSKKGTCFELYFPVTKAQPVHTEALPFGDYSGNGEKILVVDDESSQREIASALLTQLGYTANTVSSGEEALDYLGKNSVDLLVLDMIMPSGMNGRETYQRAIKMKPGQKAIIASGFAQTADVIGAQEDGAGMFIKKPYTMEKFGIAIREELSKETFSEQN